MLASHEIDEFVERGYVPLRGAFSPALAGRCRRLAAGQLGIEDEDPSTWSAPVVRGLVEGEPLREAANAPRLIDAIRQLVEPDRWLPRQNLGVFIVRLPSSVDPGDAGWHVDSSFQADGDGQWLVNYRSKARALLLLCLLSDVGPNDVPTRIVPGSHGDMARRLRPFGEEGGVVGATVPVPQGGPDIDYATGEAGDVYLCHPFLVHAAQWPHLGARPRYITQPPIVLADALNLNGPGRTSPVALAVRRALHT